LTDIEDLESEVEKWCHCVNCVAHRFKAPRVSCIDSEMNGIETLAQAADYLDTLVELPTPVPTDLDNYVDEFANIVNNFVDKTTKIREEWNFSDGLNKRKYEVYSEESSAYDYNCNAGYGFVDDIATRGIVYNNDTVAAPFPVKIPDSPALAGYLNDTDDMQL